MPTFVHPQIHTPRHLIAIAVLVCAALVCATRASAANLASKPTAPAVSPVPPEPVPEANPLRTADPTIVQEAVTDAWTTFQRSCRPCHGPLGAGDGPYAGVFPRKAADLRRPNRAIAGDATRFTRIRDGAAALAERPWESNMPAFGDELDSRQIWALVALLDELGKDDSGIDPSATGGDVYVARCAVCHGRTGAGDGPAANELLPLPRNFVQATYRVRSTEYGAAPISADIISAATRGFGNTAMGRFASLGPTHLEDAAAFIRDFAPAAFAAEPKILPRETFDPEPIPQLVARGRGIYEQAKCGDCHGTEGRGDGPSVTTLKDDTGRPSIPTNFTKRWQLKTTGGASDLFRVITGGMNGTAMPSYDATLGAADRWALSNYLERLGRTWPGFAPNIQASVRTEAIPSDPTSPFWKTIPARSVPLGPQVDVAPHWTQPSVDLVDVTVAVSGDQMGILMVWDDRTRNVTNDDAGGVTSIATALSRYESWRLADQVAVQVPEKLEPKGALPPAYLGDDRRPVRRWTWSAEREERGERQAVIDRVAGPRATPTTVTDAPPVQAVSRYVDGQWRVLLLTKRPPKAATSIPLAFQAWDGGAGESGRWQSSSGWLTLKLQ